MSGPAGRLGRVAGDVADRPEDPGFVGEGEFGLVRRRRRVGASVAAVLVAGGIAVGILVAAGAFSSPPLLVVADGRVLTVAEVVGSRADDVWVRGDLAAEHAGDASSFALLTAAFLCEPGTEVARGRPPCAPGLEVTWEAASDIVFVWRTREGWVYRGSVDDRRMVVREVRALVDGELAHAPPSGWVSGEAHEQTPYGEARVRLTVAPAEFEPGADMVFYLANTGELRLGRKYGYVIERWDGEQWVYAGPERRPITVYLIARSVVQGHVGYVQSTPVDSTRRRVFDEPPVPGRYRITVPTWWNPSKLYDPEARLDVTVEFRILEP